MGMHGYVHKNFGSESMALILMMNGIVDEYLKDGYRLTVRQLYYQLVARDVVPNTERSYKRVTSIVNKAKMAGLMDWEAIEDRTRAFISRNHWESAAELLHASAKQFYMDMWEGQPERVFVIVEKEALAGVLERVCNEYDVPLLAARGYPSGTVLREFCVDQLYEAAQANQSVTILHLGDHDPSGIDMTRDLAERIKIFTDDISEYPADLTRIALTMEQITKQKPPHNPAKQTDARFKSYQQKYGTRSWELDALKPAFLASLVTQHIERHIDDSIWQEREELIKATRTKMLKVATDFEKKKI